MAYAAEACQTKTRQVEKVTNVPYEIWADVPRANYGNVWAKTGTTDVWGKTGTTNVWGKTGTRTSDVYENLYQVTAHTNVYQYTERIGSRSFTYTLTSSQYGLNSPFYCTGSWYRWPNTATWLNDVEPDCGGHINILYNNNVYYWQSHANVYKAGGTVSVKTGTQTTDVYGWVATDTYGWVTQDVYGWVATDTYGWVTQDVFGWVWGITSYTDVRTLIESGTTPKIELVTEEYQECVRPT